MVISIPRSLYQLTHYDNDAVV